MSRRKRDPLEPLNCTVTTNRLRDVIWEVGNQLLQARPGSAREYAADYIAALFHRLYVTDKASMEKPEPIITAGGLKLTVEDMPVDGPPGTLVAKDFIKTTRKELLWGYVGGGMAFVVPELHSERRERNGAMDTMDQWIIAAFESPQAGSDGQSRAIS